MTAAPGRTDARRNREAILRTADAAFTQDDEVVSLHEIARRTGLGRATVYRHFPDRQALAVAVAERQLDILSEAVRAPEEFRCPFTEVLRGVLKASLSRRPLVALMQEMPERDRRRQSDTLIRVLAPALRAAQAAGEIRPDLEPDDLRMILRMVDAAAEDLPEGDGRGPAVERLVSMLVAGVRAGARRPAGDG